MAIAEDCIVCRLESLEVFISLEVCSSQECKCYAEDQHGQDESAHQKPESGPPSQRYSFHDKDRGTYTQIKALQDVSISVT